MGHALVDLLASLGGEKSFADLEQAAREAFGPDAVFANCHGDSFDFASLVRFLASKGKLAVDGDRVRLGIVPPCSHHH
jgi:probable metal-binding protein